MTNFNGEPYSIFRLQIIAIVYDVTNEMTFLNVASWVKTIRELCTVHGNPPLLAIIGNKSDMEHQRIVKLDRQKQLASELHVTSHVTSARTGEGVGPPSTFFIGPWLSPELYKLIDYVHHRSLNTNFLKADE